MRLLAHPCEKPRSSVATSSCRSLSPHSSTSSSTRQCAFSDESPLPCSSQAFKPCRPSTWRPCRSSPPRPCAASCAPRARQPLQPRPAAAAGAQTTCLDGSELSEFAWRKGEKMTKVEKTLRHGTQGMPQQHHLLRRWPRRRHQQHRGCAVVLQPVQQRRQVAQGARTSCHSPFLGSKRPSQGPTPSSRRQQQHIAAIQDGTAQLATAGTNQMPPAFFCKSLLCQPKWFSLERRPLPRVSNGTLGMCASDISLCHTLNQRT